VVIKQLKNMGNRKTTKQIKKQFVVPPPAAAPACPKVGPSPQDFPEGSYTYFFFGMEIGKGSNSFLIMKILDLLLNF
jgi:hypothetical protein